MRSDEQARTQHGRALRLLTVAAIALLLSGCAKLFYERLDTLAVWYISNLVTLDTQQRSEVEEWLSRTHDWHRTSELTRYSEFLHQLADRSVSPIDRDTYMQLGREVEAFGQALVAQAAPDALRLLRSLTPAQFTELDANLDKRGRERARESEKLLQKGKWVEDRTRDLVRGLKRWTGDATEGQRDILAGTAAKLEPTAQEWLESQRQWRASMRAALEAPEPNEERVTQLLRKPQSEWTAEYTAKNERNRQRSLDMIVALDASLTAAQREHLKRELHELAERIEHLSKN